MTMTRQAARQGAFILAVAAATHILHDGLTNSVYLIFLLLREELHLSLFQVGLMKSSYAGALGFGQAPMSLLASRTGEGPLLALGTFGLALGFMLVGWVPTYWGLLLVLLCAGIGASVQHPLASSLVSRAFQSGSYRLALGTYNFSGDIGKLAIPGLVGFGLASFGWRWPVTLLGAFGLLAAGLLWVAIGRARPAPLETSADLHGGVWGIRHRHGFRILASLGMLDDSGRTVTLTFLPFLLLQKGMTTGEITVVLMLLFAGGATGKFVCGWLAETVGVVRMIILTEATTALLLLLVLFSPPSLIPILPLPLGLGLNGTSSVLYATVAEMAVQGQESRAFGLYYTLVLGVGALAPSLFGFVSDLTSVRAVLMILALLLLFTIPLALGLPRVARSFPSEKTSATGHN